MPELAPAQGVRTGTSPGPALVEAGAGSLSLGFVPGQADWTGRKQGNLASDRNRSRRRVCPTQAWLGCLRQWGLVATPAPITVWTRESGTLAGTRGG